MPYLLYGGAALIGYFFFAKSSKDVAQSAQVAADAGERTSDAILKIVVASAIGFLLYKKFFQK